MLNASRTLFPKCVEGILTIVLSTFYENKGFNPFFFTFYA